ncbi:MAG: PEP/pyruvate-binding domain-containing protein [Oscillospiraceae bacterium]|nr:PEP/pyruvate-binding domain-containing protein [Oscillospiraceae bacterium]
MKYIFAFDKISDDEIQYAGGKGASLVRMRRSGLRVPDGFIILSSAFSENGLCPEAQSELKSLICSLSGSCTYAVRSSALNEDGGTASFAGEYESVTDIQRNKIWDAVRTVAQSADNLRVKQYAFLMNKDKSSVAVIIQRFVKPEFAGVLFTSDIITGSSAGMQGNYVHGDGEQLVSGSADACEFSFNALRYNYSGSDEMKKYARWLFRCAVKIKKLFGCPMDIEWAVSASQLYILQARPVTTLRRFNPESYEINGSLSGEFLFSKTNVGEIFMSNVSPMTFSMLETICEMIGVPCFIDNICSQAYCNLSVVCSMLVSFGLSKRKAFSLISDIAGKIPDGAEIPVFKFDKGNFLRRISSLALSGTKRSGIKMSTAEFTGKIPELSDQIIKHIRSIDNSTELLEYWNTTCKDFMPKVMKTITSLFPVMKPFLKTSKKLADIVGEEFACELCAGSMGILESMKPLLMLEDVIEGKASREDYIKQCGHRSAYEMELAEPYPYENPDFPENIIEEHIKSGVNVHKMQLERESRYKEAVSRFKQQYPKKSAWFDRTISGYIKANQLRENIRSKAVRLFCILREFLLKTAELSNIGNDIFMLYFPEAIQLLEGENKVLKNIPARKRSFKKYKSYPAFPNVILGRFDPEKWISDKTNRFDFYSAQYDVSCTADIRGFAGASGIVTGKARVITDLSDAASLLTGEILVTTAANIGWTVIFPKTSAIVTDIGAPLSHAAIVAREFGIPAVVGCSNATTLIKTGDMIRVNGSCGTVEKIK